MSRLLGAHDPHRDRHSHIGVGVREGVDVSKLILEKQRDGSYIGAGTLGAKGTVRMPGAGCSGGGVWVNQRASVLATRVEGHFESSGINPEALNEYLAAEN